MCHIIALFAWISTTGITKHGTGNKPWRGYSKNECHLLKLYRRDPTEGVRERRHDTALGAAVVRSQWPLASSPAVCHALFFNKPVSSYTPTALDIHRPQQPKRHRNEHITWMMSLTLQWWKTAQHCRGRNSTGQLPLWTKAPIIRINTLVKNDCM